MYVALAALLTVKRARKRFLRPQLIEKVWKQKPRQTVVVVLWGKIAAHMASIKTV